MNFETLALEMLLFCVLGLLYYFYQKKKITQFEIEKGPLIMGYILQASLSDRGDTPEPMIDGIIEAIDDYLQNKTATPPTILLKHFAASEKCSPELRDIILEGLAELEA